MTAILHQLFIVRQAQYTECTWFYYIKVELVIRKKEKKKNLLQYSSPIYLELWFASPQLIVKFLSYADSVSALAEICVRFR